MTTKPVVRPVVLVTGAGRRLGIATAIARRLAETGWDVAFTHFDAYDAGMPWGKDDGAAEALLGQPRDAAGLVAFLCSPDGEWINGQVLHSNGGL